jgi:hypothetical protein
MRILMATDLREDILQIAGDVVIWMSTSAFQGREGGRRGRVDAGRGREEEGRNGAKGWGDGGRGGSASTSRGYGAKTPDSHLHESQVVFPPSFQSAAVTLSSTSKSHLAPFRGLLSAPDVSEDF